MVRARGGGRRAVRVRGSWVRHQRRRVCQSLAWFLVQSAFLALDTLTLAPLGAQKCRDFAKWRQACGGLGIQMRHPVYYSAPIVPYLEYYFTSIIEYRRPPGLCNLGCATSGYATSTASTADRPDMRAGPQG